MPIDLDDMFTTFGRHADTIPLAPPERARRRGQQRTRATIAAAAAVCLLAAGLGAVVVRHERSGAQVASKRDLPAVGAPIELGDGARVSTAVGDGDRLYTASQTPDGLLCLNAVDLRTGAVVWTVPQVTDRTADTFFLNALPAALTLTFAQGAEGQTTLVLDPASGRQRWSLTSMAAETLISHESGLIRASAGRTEAFDWATGARRWQQPASADPQVQTVATYVDRNEDILLGRPAALTDNRLVQVTRAGKVQVRDITNGKLLRTVNSVPPDRDPRTYLAYDGWLYNDEHECCGESGYRIRATDLRSDRGESKVVFTRGPGYQLSMLQMCGELRVCVTDQGPTGPATVSMLDLATARQLWQVDAPRDGASASTVNGYTVVGGGNGGGVVYDRAGRRVLSLPETSVSWLDTDTLLVLPAFVAGTVSKVTLPDGRVTPLGEMPPPTDACAWTTGRLACPVGSSLRIWDISE
jgi:hypothetical protein